MSTEPKQPVLQVEQLSFTYEATGTPILNGISFELREQDAALVLGPSGSGKSTLAFCLNGLYPEAIDGFQTGTVRLQGQSLLEYDRTEISKRVGIVFQDPESQFCMVSVEDELAFGLENIEVPPGQIRGKIDGALEVTGLSAWKKSKIHQLSGGMKQKLALACVLAMEPDLLILDEPTANLDPMSTRELVQLVESIRRQRSLTLLIVEHKLDEWMRIANRALVMNRSGSLMFNGPAEECFSDHRELLEAEGIWIPSVTRIGREWKAKRIYMADRLPVTEQSLIAGVGQPAQAMNELDSILQTVPSGPGKGKAGGPLLEVKHLSCERGGKRILRDMNVTLNPGEILAVLGPNGAGKSTLALAMAGLSQGRTQGRVLLKGRDLSSWPERELRRVLGIVFQNPEHQFVTGSVFDEVALSLRMQGFSGAELESRVNAVLQQFRLLLHAEENPFAISQGQKRRLSVAAMLADEQQVLVLDEPTFGQDAHTAGQLMTMLRSYADRGNAAVVITHDMELVLKYADRMLIMQDGETRFIGACPEVWNQHAALLMEARLVPPVALSLRMQLEAQSYENGGDRHAVR